MGPPKLLISLSFPNLTVFAKTALSGYNNPYFWIHVPVGLAEHQEAGIKRQNDVRKTAATLVSRGYFSA
jgi:hypothetical protein